jgi:uncharacterized protein YbcV (DUF1398 family)
MFTIEQIKVAHSRVKSGADFPNYIQDLIQLGVKSYDTFVADGHAVYFGVDNHQTQSEGKYAELTVVDKSNIEQFKHYLKIHQKGETDYLTFCTHSAQCGVEKWTVETTAMTCTYYDKDGNKILEERIPA